MLKQGSPWCFSHRAIILGKSVRFILFFHIWAIFLFLGKLKKVKLGLLFFVLRHLQAATPRNHTAQEQSWTDVVQNTCSQKFSQFHRKIPVLESYFNKIILIKRDSKCFLVKFAEFLRTPFFTEHLRWMVLSAVCF